MYFYLSLSISECLLFFSFSLSLSLCLSVFINNSLFRPIEKVCNGQGEEECRTVYESSCSTRYYQCHGSVQKNGSSFNIVLNNKQINKNSISGNTMISDIQLFQALIFKTLKCRYSSLNFLCVVFMIIIFIMIIFRYIEKTPGKFVGDTACEKLPVEVILHMYI